MSFVSRIGAHIVPTTFPMFSCISVVGTLASLPKFQAILKQWTSFQKEYIHTFYWRNGDPFINLRKYRDGTFAIFIAVGFLAIGIVFLVSSNMCGNTSSFLFPTEGIPKFTAPFTMIIIIGGHGMHFLLLRTLIEAFAQIHEGISIWIKEEGRVGPIYNSEFKSVQENVKKWTNLVLHAKKQVECTGHALAFHHVATIFINFLFLCLGVFSVLSSKSGPVEGDNGYIFLMFCSWGFTLLIAKAFMCDRILEEVCYLIVRK